MSTADGDKLSEFDGRNYAKPLLVNYGSIAETTGRLRGEDAPLTVDANIDLPSQLPLP